MIDGYVSLARVVALFQLAAEYPATFGSDTRTWPRSKLSEWIQVMKVIAATGVKLP